MYLVAVVAILRDWLLHDHIAGNSNRLGDAPMCTAEGGRLKHRDCSDELVTR
jgi:hypothetical protein